MGRLLEWFAPHKAALVAVSGGVDSALVALAAFRALGAGATAVTADYKTLPQDELASARDVCRHIGIRHEIIEYDELENEAFAANDSRRCFHCRSELGWRLRELGARLRCRVIADGTNLDDLGDYRPGIEAMRNSDVRSPLSEAGFAKSDVRRCARLEGLPVWDRPSNSCLASRIPWGRRVTAERLARIELAESMVKNATHARQVRVRDMGGRASIEVGAADLPRLGPAVMLKLRPKMEAIGFSSVEMSPAQYRPGRINVVAD